MRRGADAVALSRAGVVAAILWVVGIGARMGFALYSSHGGGPAIARRAGAMRQTGAGRFAQPNPHSARRTT
jgi:hypothetical protein